MKFTKSEAALLFQPEKQPAASQRGATNANVPSDAVSPGSNLPPAHLAAHPAQLLKKIAASLWQKVDSPNLSKKEQRQRMLDLLQWFSLKQGFEFEHSSRQDYRSQGSKVEGRLHARVKRGADIVAIELCFALDETVLIKLFSAHLQGNATLLIWLGAPLDKNVLLARALQLTGRGSITWLGLVQVSPQGPASARPHASK